MDHHSQPVGAARSSDPAWVPPRPAGALGFPCRDADFDVLPGFRRPPAGYGQVAFHWWLGAPLTRGQLRWQLDQLAAAGGISGIQINYAQDYPTADCTTAWGNTMHSDPPLFSDAWWELLGWFADEAARHGMTVSLSDYCLGPGQGWIFDELVQAHPEMAGRVLCHAVHDCPAGPHCLELPAHWLSVMAFEPQGEAAIPGSLRDLRDMIDRDILRSNAPAPFRLIVISAPPVQASLDPLHPDAGRLYAEAFFGLFERRLPGQAGRVLNFFFSDELSFGVHGNLWTPRFPAEFIQRKGYDLLPELPALFMGIGPRTAKVRLDYRDVMVALAEEGYHRPVFDWHQQRGMIYGCDHGGRGTNVVEFGDYVRAMRWNQGPGCDQPWLLADLIKNKIASSIAHLYERPRVWLEGFHSSGWGTTTTGLVDATFANFAHGHNLLSLHGLYYTLRGGYWEWAPPCNHFRMPYWPHLQGYLACVERLSYLLSQGRHCCDVAILYPVAPMEAGLEGQAAVQAAFDAGRALYAQGVDFDFMDFESLARAEIEAGRLVVTGERYRVLVLPAMRAIRWSTLTQAVAFQQAGGLVVLLGALPMASDRAGSDDPEVDALVAQLTIRVADAARLATLVASAFTRDIEWLTPLPPFAPPSKNLIPEGIAPDGTAFNFLHRRIGARDVYLIHGVPAGTECRLRATGAVEWWDPWTGGRHPLPVLEQTAETTRLRLPLAEHDAQIIVFQPGSPVLADRPADNLPPSIIPLDGAWDFTLLPTRDNQYGDFHWPPTPDLVGAEARRFRYHQEDEAPEACHSPCFDDADWPQVTCGFGQRFWRLGPLSAAADVDDALIPLTVVDPAVPVPVDGVPQRWQPYAFSWRWGAEGDPGPQGWHGLKARIGDDFIALGARGKRPWYVGHGDYEPEPAGNRYYLWTSVRCEATTEVRVQAGGLLPTAAWLGGRPLTDWQRPFVLPKGYTPLLLRYDGVGRGHFLLAHAEAHFPPASQGTLAMRWHDQRTILPFDVYPGVTQPYGWYRFMAPPGLHELVIPTRAQLNAWVAGVAQTPIAHPDGWLVTLPEPPAEPALVALRLALGDGCHGGAAIPAPVRIRCREGKLPVGDWSKIDALASYSGGAWYRRSVTLSAAESAGRITLDLGAVASSAEVWLNNQRVGVRLAPPWQFDLTPHVHPGANQLAVLVYNTLANQYLDIPTSYRGDLSSGLLGPVRLVLGPHAVHDFARPRPERVLRTP